MNNKVILFLNGEAPTQAPLLTNYHKIFCTDGSFLYLQKLGIKPDVITGDFDSIQINKFREEIQKIHTPDQNYTDFEKALQIISEEGFDTVDVYGASGKQQDHFIGNLNAAYKFKDKLHIQFFDNYSTYFFIDKESILRNVRDKTISLIPFPSAKNINTKGLQYPLNNGELNLLNMVGTRNKAIENEVKITFESGEIVIFVID